MHTDDFGEGAMFLEVGLRFPVMTFVRLFYRALEPNAGRYVD
ncbi:hypothetical protein GGR95_002681 [Sulfitobacter undariae]|uniref:Uncharacterized protein n=1 Tax=Sulfitobacter undariae TaxID=1563671 RepID=A0A7W6E5B8_9RHOB|nr:hypothetical protein [Sulfitobacter undariae]